MSEPFKLVFLDPRMESVHNEFRSNRVWNRERANAPVQLCKVDVFREAVSRKSDLAIVFPFEGQFNNGSWEFNESYSTQCPLFVSYDVAFKLNMFFAFAENNKAMSAEIDKLFKEPEQARDTLMQLVQHVLRGIDDQGFKVMGDNPLPVLPNSGIKLEQKQLETAEA